jgi:aromatic ring-cleaving dioxygenase
MQPGPNSVHGPAGVYSAPMTRTTPQPLAAVASFHAHIYFDSAAQREIAMTLREQIGERFAVTLGHVHDRLVGPHVRTMYQVAFDVATFGNFVPWLMLNRQGLTVLVHPNTRDERRDHLVHALWMGEVLDIVNVDGLFTDGEAELPRPVNTQPTVAP